MKTSEILGKLASAIAELQRNNACAIDAELSVQFRDALAAMGIFVCGGAYDQDNNKQFFYL
jgi:hypothetical protein